MDRQMSVQLRLNTSRNKVLQPHTLHMNSLQLVVIRRRSATGQLLLWKNWDHLRRSTLDALVRLAQAEKPLIAYWAVTLLGRAGPDAKVHQRTLANLLQNSGDLAVQEKAAWSLGRIHADSPEATQALQRAAVSAESRLSRVAAKALQQTQT